MNETSFEQQFELMQIQNIMDQIKYKIMIMSNKGGVGKSTIAAIIADELASQNKKIGLLDIDIHGPSQAKIFNLNNQKLKTDKNNNIIPFKAKKNLQVVSVAGLLENENQPIIWRGPLKINLIKQFLTNVLWGNLDYLIIDAPPGTGDEPLTITQLISNLNGLIIVTTPQDLALLDSRKAITFAKKTNTQVLGVIKNMSYVHCPHCEKKINLFKINDIENAIKVMNVNILGSLPFESKLLKCMDKGNSFVKIHKKTNLYQILKNIIHKIQSCVEKK